MSFFKIILMAFLTVASIAQAQLVPGPSHGQPPPSSSLPPEPGVIYPIQGAVLSNGVLYYRGSPLASNIISASSAYSTIKGIFIFMVDGAGVPYYYSEKSNQIFRVNNNTSNIYSIDSVFVDPMGYIKMNVTYGSGNRAGVTTSIYLGNVGPYRPPQAGEIYPVSGALLSDNTLYYKGTAIASNVRFATSAYSTTKGLFIFMTDFNGTPYYYSEASRQIIQINKSTTNIYSIDSVFIERNGYIKMNVTYGSGNQAGVTTSIYLGN